MNKPKYKTIKQYNFFDCLDYIEETYDLDTDAFKQFAIEWVGGNDKMFMMSDEMMSEDDPVYDKFKEEFLGDDTEVGFWISW